MTYQNYAYQMLPLVEDEMRQVILLCRSSSLSESTGFGGVGLWDELYQMLVYHMGWAETTGESGGKRLRPLILLLVNEAAGGNWHLVTPAAAAVELVHNFSLIHDDIEDNSPLRHGRPTVWKKWGIAQAINTGDVLFTLAQKAMLRLQTSLEPSLTLKATQIFQDACLAITQGQYLDIAYETERFLPLSTYWPMVAGKTASLLAICAELGATLAQARPETCQAYRKFGLYLGLAFQIQDDILGIWGDTALTGKSASSDLLSGKKSLPVLFGLEQKGEFARRWLAGPIQVEEVGEIAKQLRAEGAYAYTDEMAQKYTEKALQNLETAMPSPHGGEALRSLALDLLRRNV